MSKKSKEMMERFGKLLMENVRDRSLCMDSLFDHKYKQISSKVKREDFNKFSNEQKDIILELIKNTVDNCLFNFLIMITEENDISKFIDFKLRDGKAVINPVEESDMLAAEVIIDDSWISKYSKFDMDKYSKMIYEKKSFWQRLFKK